MKVKRGRGNGLALFQSDFHTCVVRLSLRALTIDCLINATKKEKENVLGQ